MREIREVVVVIASCMPKDSWDVVVRRGPERQAETIRWIAPGATKLEIWFKELEQKPERAKMQLKLQPDPRAGKTKSVPNAASLPGLVSRGTRGGLAPTCELKWSDFPTKKMGDCVGYGFRATYPNGSTLEADPVIIWQP